MMLLEESINNLYFFGLEGLDIYIIRVRSYDLNLFFLRINLM